MNQEADWAEFKAKIEEPDQPECPFCGIRHEPAQAHPYCDMATRFQFWRQQTRQS